MKDKWAAAVLAISCLAAVRLWVLPLGNSLWLDESVIAAVVRTGILSSPHVLGGSQSLLYCLIEWPLAYPSQFTEILMRLPSLIAGVCTVYLYCRIGHEFLGGDGGLILAAAAIGLPSAMSDPANARPYALAMLAHVGGILCLMRWLRSGRMRDCCLWAIAAGVATDLHLFFAVALGPELAFVLWRSQRSHFGTWRSQRSHFGTLAISMLIACAVMSPAFAQAILMWGDAGGLIYLDPPRFAAIVQLLVPPSLIAPAALVFSLALPGKRRFSLNSAPSGIVILALLLLLPMPLFFVLGHVSGIQLFQARYLSPAFPGIVILWGWVLAGVEPRRLRYTSVIAGLVTATIVTGGIAPIPDWHSEDWRSAVRNMPESGAMLVYSGLVETRRIDWLRDPRRWSYLIAPVLVYRKVEFDRAFLLPFDCRERDTHYVDHLIISELKNHHAITLILREGFASEQWLRWLSGRLGWDGFQMISRARYRKVEVMTFRKVA